VEEEHMSLLMVNHSKKIKLTEITWGTKLKKKLQDMGLTPGVEFSIVSQTGHGPVVLDVRGTRLALGRGIVSKIFVENVA